MILTIAEVAKIIFISYSKFIFSKKIRHGHITFFEVIKPVLRFYNFFERLITWNWVLRHKIASYDIKWKKDLFSIAKRINFGLK